MDQISVDLSGVTKSFDADEIRLEGARVSAPGLHVAPEDRNVGFVFQSCALWPHMNLRGNVLFPAETRGAGTAEARGIADRNLRAVDLTAFADRHPAVLSGGQRQRVALRGRARAVLMDEPLANLDPHLRGRMEAEIARIHSESG
ncbi:MAG: ATP-binding cassette domain-containing protein [Antarcticimicrobium sp.]|uniref:ATP-binding cassette domain-containing protein n=1 Tax=Antarcticimicrobium sp. TaxID=2824147 RepID=UPI002615404F|nr:ATP-binding cassette domain-containing protein [Antarcticimicrobium sp.]MDF1716220.1 ATP-binding cassette domain-containing protein [Antarcticimicrobium sp.]